MSVVSISQRCREVIVTEAEVKDLQEAREVLLAEALDREATARHKRGLIAALTVSLAMIQLSIR